MDHAVDLCAGVECAVRAVPAIVCPEVGHAGSHAVEGAVAFNGVADEHCLMALAEAGEERGDEADADAAAEVAAERGQAGDFVVLFLGDSGVAESVDGDEEEREADGDDGAPAYGETEVDLLVDAGHAVEAEGGDDESEGDDFAGVEFGREGAGDGEEDHEDESAGGDGHAGLAGGVAHDFLQVLGDEDGGGVEAGSDHEHDELGHGDVAAFEEVQVDDGVVDTEFAPKEEGEGDDGHDERGANEGGAEPVVFLAFVEHDLEGGDEEDEKAESPVVDAFALFAAFGEVGRVFDEALGEDEGEDADGDVEKEQPAPAGVVDDPAADGGAEGGSEDDGHAVDGEGHAAFLGREGVGEDGLLAGLEASAGQALEDAEEDEHGEGRGESAEQRGESEEGDAAHVEPFTPDAVGDPAADGQDDGVGDEVAGEDPGGFADAGAQGAGHVGHGDVDDGGVERLHEGGEGDGDGDDPGIGFGPPCIVEGEGCRRQEWSFDSSQNCRLTSVRVSVSGARWRLPERRSDRLDGYERG